MDIMRRISNSKTKKTEAKSLNNCSRKLPELPLDITLNIISWLPVKSIMRCKSLAKAFHQLISEQPFSQLQLYRTNKSTLFYTIYFTGSSDICIFSYLIEFDQKVINNKREGNRFTKLPISYLKRLPGCAYTAFYYDSMCAYCNGLVCSMKLEPESQLDYLLVIKSIMGQFIQLPEPAISRYNLLAYGIGFCQLTKRYKVLRILINYRSGKLDYNSEIFTIGSDQYWRSLECVPYNINMDYGALKPHPPMLAFRSALHTLLFEWAGGGTCICAFDMTEEKVSAIPMPPQVDASFARLTVLVDRLSVWEGHSHAYEDVNVWVMNDYGVKCSWTKQFVFKLSTLSSSITDPYGLIPLTLLPEGVLVVSDCFQVLFYDTKKDKCLRVVVGDTEELSCFIPFVPSFVPLRDQFQG